MAASFVGLANTVSPNASARGPARAASRSLVDLLASNFTTLNFRNTGFQRTMRFTMRVSTKQHNEADGDLH